MWKQNYLNAKTDGQGLGQARQPTMRSGVKKNNIFTHYIWQFPAAREWFSVPRVIFYWSSFETPWLCLFIHHDLSLFYFKHSYSQSCVSSTITESCFPEMSALPVGIHQNSLKMMIFFFPLMYLFLDMATNHSLFSPHELLSVLSICPSLQSAVFVRCLIISALCCVVSCLWIKFLTRSDLSRSSKEFYLFHRVTPNSAIFAGPHCNSKSSGYSHSLAVQK